MRDFDDNLDIDDLPQIQTEKRETPQEPPKAIKPPKTKGISPWATAVTAVVIATIALLISFYQIYRQSLELEDARERVASLENRLSSTDESVSQSSVAIQVKLKELKDKTDELWKQMDKLWASAWRRNQTEIEEQGESIKGLTSQLKTVQDDLGRIDKAAKTSKEEILVLRAETENIANLRQTIKDQNASIKVLKDQLALLEKENKSLKSTLEEHKEWLQANDAFRLQTNKSIGRLEQMIKQGQSTP